MSREIDFKAWITTQNRMIDVYGFNENFVFEKTPNSPCENENIIPIEECVLLQFTGFKDCEGTKIYDGDILGDWTDCDGEMVQSNDLVYFDEVLGSWMIDCSLNHDRSFSSSLFASLNDFEYKVIGTLK